MIYKVYVSDFSYPLVTTDKGRAYQMRADAINAGKRVIITRMTLETYKRSIIDDQRREERTATLPK